MADNTATGWCPARFALPPGAILTLCVVVSSCGGAANEQPVHVATWQLSESPLVAIGGTDSSSTLAFHQVRSVVLDVERNIVVADGGSNEVRIFDLSGDLKRRFGRYGGGPGEFSHLLRAGSYRGDSLYTGEGMGRRIAVWTADGIVVRTIPLDDPRLIQDVIALSDGSFAAIYRKPERPTSVEGTFVFDSLSLYVFNDTGLPIRSVPSRPGRRYVASRTFTNVVLMQPPSFWPRAVYTVGKDHSYYGWSSAWQIFRQRLEDGAVDTLRLERRRRPMTEEMLANHVQSRLDRPNSTRDARTREYFSTLNRVDSLPSFDRIVEDDSSRVWVREFRVAEDTVDHWFVFAADGTLAAVVTAPPSLDVMHIRDDLVAGVMSDELDREIVVVYALNRN